AATGRDVHTFGIPAHGTNRHEPHETAYGQSSSVCFWIKAMSGGRCCVDGPGQRLEAVAEQTAGRLVRSRQPEATQQPPTTALGRLRGRLPLAQGAGQLPASVGALRKHFAAAGADRALQLEGL